MPTEIRVRDHRLRPLQDTILALNARREERQWAIIDSVFVFDSLDLNEYYSDEVFRVKKPAAIRGSVEKLERFKIEAAAEQPSDKDSVLMCSICLGELLIGSEALRMPKPCSHVYHQVCINKWFNICNTCPLCRRTI